MRSHTVGIFLSYAHADDALRREFEPWANSLERSGARFWFDGDLIPGTAWDAEIRARLAESEIVCYLVTQRSLTSAYIEQHEILEVRAEADEGTKTLVPILCEESTFRQSPLSRFTPAGGLLPLSAYFDRSAFWKRVYESLIQTVVAWNKHADPTGLAARFGADPRLERMPALFPGIPEMPLEASFVELQIAPAGLSEPAVMPTGIASDLTESTPNRVTSLDLRDALEGATAKRFLILGNPGAGKSTLMRRIAANIAQRRWRRWNVAPLVELRDVKRRARPEDIAGPVDLLANILKDAGLGTQRAANLAAEWTSGATDGARPLLLIDGLDEIVGDLALHGAVCRALSRMPRQIDWILTSRTTGLTQSLGEDRRYAIAPLDDHSIETIAGMWFRHAPAEVLHPKIAEAERRDALLLREIFANRRLDEMARNPFLLTALCFLRGSIAPDQPLPSTRIAVYDVLIERIAELARSVAERDSVLDRRAHRHLEEFCHWLYAGGVGAPAQSFLRDDWQTFAEENPGLPAVDLDRDVLPARLITQVDMVQPRMQFVHLSLQEYLIARAMLRRPPLDAQNLRFLPIWRPVLTFYGAMLLQKRKREEFGALLRSIAEPPDLTNRMLIEAAALVGETDLILTSQFLGYELAERLWESWVSGPDHLALAAFRALARMPADVVDPKIELLIRETRTRVGEIVAKYERAFATSERARALAEIHLASELREAREHYANPFALLAERRDGQSEKQLISAFLDETDEWMSIYMAPAVAAALTRVGRAELLAAVPAALARPQHGGFMELLESMDHADVVDCVAGILQQMDVDAPGYSRLLQTLGTGSARSVLVLEREARRLIAAQHADPDNQETHYALSMALAGLVRSKTQRAKDSYRRLLEAGLNEVQDLEERRFVTELELGVVDEPALLTEATAAEDGEALNNFLELLITPDPLPIFSAKLIGGLAQLVDGVDPNYYHWSHIYALDTVRLENGDAPAVAEQALARLDLLIRHDHSPLLPTTWIPLVPDQSAPENGSRWSVHNEIEEDRLDLNDETPADDPRQELPALADYLASIARWHQQTEGLAPDIGSRAAVPALLAIATDTGRIWSATAKLAALRALPALLDAERRWMDMDEHGRIPLADQEVETLDVLTTRYFSGIAPDERGTAILRRAAGWLIGCLDPARLIQLSTDQAARAALIELSMRLGHIVYESYYVLPNGRAVELPGAPRQYLLSVMPFPCFEDFARGILDHVFAARFITSPGETAIEPAGGIVILPAKLDWEDLAKDSRAALAAHRLRDPTFPVIVTAADQAGARQALSALPDAEVLLVEGPINRTTLAPLEDWLNRVSARHTQ